MADKWATKTGTEKFFQWASIHPSKIRDFAGVKVSALGIGTYLGASDDVTDRLYEEAIVEACLKGVNFIDTAIHYRGMRSEKVIKKALKTLLSKGVFREQIVLSTKGGYLPCEVPPEHFEDYIREHYLDTKILAREDIVLDCHAMSPSFLESQVKMSLKNMGVDAIDLYLLHNPEIQLQEIGEEAFYKRLTLAFSLLEKKVQEKKIRFYGLATWNGFRQKKNPLLLEKVLASAKEAGGEAHHFQAVELPLNLVMLEALKVKNQPTEKEEKNILELLEEKKISLLTSSPLMQGQVLHLSPHVFEKLPQEKSRALQALQFVLSTPHLSTAFVGMKTRQYLEENLEALKLASWNKESYTNLQGLS